MFDLFDDMGKHIYFDTGKVLIVLHFHKRHLQKDVRYTYETYHCNNIAKVTQRQKRRQRTTRQYGGRVLVFRIVPLQRGHGLGGL